MSRSSPPLRRLPPKLPAEAKVRLDKLEEWSEEPARDAAAVLSTADEPANGEGEGRAVPPKIKGVAAYPWIEYDGVPVLSSVLLRIPKSLHMKVKFLGETTYGDSMNKIMQRAIEREVKEMLRKRGIDS